MLEKYTGRTISDAYEIEEHGIHLPRYPYFPEYDRPGSCHYYYRRSTQYLTCQTARFLLFGGGHTTTLAEDGAIDPLRDLNSWWQGFYREHFGAQTGEVIKYGEERTWQDVFLQNPDSRIIAPHPYPTHKTGEHRYYLENPDLIRRLNDKGRMRELTSHCIPYTVYDATQFTQQIWRDEWSLPFVIKLTAPSGGGDGVVICRDESDIQEALRRFEGHEVKIEEYIGAWTDNYNLNLHVSRDGQIRFIGGSSQKISATARYEGNHIELDWQPDPELGSICEEIARSAWEMGWFGVCGLDIIRSEDNKLYFIDPNFRLNGSTPFYLMRDYFQTHFQRPNLETGYFSFPGDPLEFLEAFRPEITKKILAPIGLYYDPRYDQKTRVYLAQVSEGDIGEHAHIRALLARQNLTPGIQL